MPSSSSNVKFLKPWYAIESNSEMFEQELYKEICKGHILYGIKVDTIARRLDCDDFLFLLLDLEPQVAEVHLTFSKNNEIDPNWPNARIFSDIHKWVTQIMLPQHQEFNEIER